MKIDNPLYLSVDLLSWGIVSQEHGSLLEPTTPEILNIYRTVMQRDRGTCYYCGFTAPKFQEVHHLDHNHENNDPSNLVTVCPLCHQCHHLSLADLHNGADIIVCPDLTQQQINHLCRMIFILQQKSELMSGSKDVPYIITGAYSVIYTDILEKGKIALAEFYKGASDCGTIGQVLLDKKAQNPNTYMERDKWLSHLRMLPKIMRFYVQTDYWRKMLDSDPKFRPDKWINFTRPEVRDNHANAVYTPPTDQEVREAFELDLSNL